MPSSAWIDDYFEWSLEGDYCCRIHEDGSFCRRELEDNVECEDCDYVSEQDEAGTTEEPFVLEASDFHNVYDDDYNYDYNYGDLNYDYDSEEKAKPELKTKPKVFDDVNDYSYTYGDLSYDYDDIKESEAKQRSIDEVSSPTEAVTTKAPSRERQLDDGWPDHSKDPSTRTIITHPKDSKLSRSLPRKRRGIPDDCKSCPISPFASNPFRPDPEVFNQYLPMFLKDNPDLYCPKAGHAAYGQVSSSISQGFLLSK